MTEAAKPNLRGKTEYEIVYVDHGYDIGADWMDEVPPDARYPDWNQSTQRVFRGRTRVVEDQGIPTAQQEADLFELHRPEREAIAEGERRRGR